jgi:hypothetical protein
MRALLFIVLGLLCFALTSCPGGGGDKGTPANANGGGGAAAPSGGS